MIDLWMHQAMSLSIAQVVFLLTLSLAAVAGIMFVLRGDSNVQP